MKEISWEMKELFSFPPQVGKAQTVTNVQIVPQWLEQKTDEGIRLMGIYHLTVEVAFSSEQADLDVIGVFVEELDMNENVGYFEYAIPLDVDLPVVEQPQLAVLSPQTNVVDGHCHIEWQVRCTYDEPMKQQVVHVEPVKQQVAHVEPVEQQVARVEPVEQKVSSNEPVKQQVAYVELFVELVRQYPVEPLESVFVLEKAVESPVQQKGIGSDDFYTMLSEQYTPHR